MELRDLSTGLMLGAAGLQTGFARVAAAKARAQANDSFIASAIHGAASAAHFDIAATLRLQLAGSTAEIERLEDKNDELYRQRKELIAHCASLLDEVAMLRARIH